MLYVNHTQNEVSFLWTIPHHSLLHLSLHTEDVPAMMSDMQCIFKNWYIYYIEEFIWTYFTYIFINMLSLGYKFLLISHFYGELHMVLHCLNLKNILWNNLKALVDQILDQSLVVLNIRHRFWLLLRTVQNQRSEQVGRVSWDSLCWLILMHRSIFRMVSIKCPDSQYKFNRSYTW